MPGGDLNGHLGRVGGVLALADRIVSWGGDGAIRQWTFEGAAIPVDGGLRGFHAHVGGVAGALAITGGLVSWGRDAIRFWTLEDELRPVVGWMIEPGHINGMRALADRLVSWDTGGAIRFWTFEGEPLSGGDHQAHPSAIQAVLTLADRLISWSADGVVRFWTLEGEPRPDTWIAPTPLQFVATEIGKIWVSLQGHPHRLILS
jgi:hypothetical protein